MSRKTVACIIICALVCFLIIYGTAFAKNPQNFNTYIRPQVVEGLTDKSIANADVVVVETGKSYKTDSSGFTQAIPVPVVYNERYRSILPQPWGDITLIVYAQGYLPVVIFNLHVYPDTTRNGPVILLFTREQAPSADPFMVVEEPERDWAKELIEKFRPK